jgi:hypothetical protein
MDHKLKYEGKGEQSIGRCSCGTAFLASYSLGSKRTAIKKEHERHVAVMEKNLLLKNFHG